MAAKAAESVDAAAMTAGATTLVLVRHGQSHKNREHRHGGTGLPLTDDGRRQAAQFAVDARRYLGTPAQIVSIDRLHCVETATIIAETFGGIVQIDENLRPFHLGVMDGLSEGEAAQRYPEWAASLAEWRRGFTPWPGIEIAGAMSQVEFNASGARFLKRAGSVPGVTVLVATRSILIMLWNQMRQPKAKSYDGHFARPWSFLEWVEFTRQPSGVWTEGRTQRASSD